MSYFCHLISQQFLVPDSCSSEYSRFYFSWQVQATADLFVATLAVTYLTDIKASVMMSYSNRDIDVRRNHHWNKCG